MGSIVDYGLVNLEINWTFSDLIAKIVFECYWQPNQEHWGHCTSLCNYCANTWIKEPLPWVSVVDFTQLLNDFSELSWREFGKDLRFEYDAYNFWHDAHALETYLMQNEDFRKSIIYKVQRSTRRWFNEEECSSSEDEESGTESDDSGDDEYEVVEVVAQLYTHSDELWNPHT